MVDFHFSYFSPSSAHSEPRQWNIDLMPTGKMADGFPRKMQFRPYPTVPYGYLGTGDGMHRRQ